jgi:hypothetical protein
MQVRVLAHLSLFQNLKLKTLLYSAFVANHTKVLAQLEEHLPIKQAVAGSSPCTPLFFRIKETSRNAKGFFYIKINHTVF